MARGRKNLSSPTNVRRDFCSLSHLPCADISAHLPVTCLLPAVTSCYQLLNGHHRPVRGTTTSLIGHNPSKRDCSPSIYFFFYLLYLHFYFIFPIYIPLSDLVYDTAFGGSAGRTPPWVNTPFSPPKHDIYPPPHSYYKR